MLASLQVRVHDLGAQMVCAGKDGMVARVVCYITCVGVWVCRLTRVVLPVFCGRASARPCLSSLISPARSTSA